MTLCFSDFVCVSPPLGGGGVWTDQHSLAVVTQHKSESFNKCEGRALFSVCVCVCVCACVRACACK